MSDLNDETPAEAANRARLMAALKAHLNLNQRAAAPGEADQIIALAHAAGGAQVLYQRIVDAAKAGNVLTDGYHQSIIKGWYARPNAAQKEILGH